MKTQHLKKDLKVFLTKTNLLKNSFYIIESQLKKSDKVLLQSFDSTELTKVGLLSSNFACRFDKNFLASSLVLKKFDNLITLINYFDQLKKKSFCSAYAIKTKSLFFKCSSVFRLFLFIDFLVIYKMKFLINNTTRSNFFVKEIICSQ
jgi:hypothetical protein